MGRFKVYNRNYEVDYIEANDWRESRYPLDKTTDPWVVESVDGGAEFYYATYEDAIASIYEGSK